MFVITISSFSQLKMQGGSSIYYCPLFAFVTTDLRILTFF